MSKQKGKTIYSTLLFVSLLLVSILILFETGILKKNIDVMSSQDKRIETVANIIKELQSNSDQLMGMRARAQEINKMRMEKQQKQADKVVSIGKINEILSDHILDSAFETTD